MSCKNHTPINTHTGESSSSHWTSVDSWSEQWICLIRQRTQGLYRWQRVLTDRFLCYLSKYNRTWEWKAVKCKVIDGDGCGVSERQGLSPVRGRQRERERERQREREIEMDSSLQTPCGKEWNIVIVYLAISTMLDTAQVFNYLLNKYMNE